MIRLVCISCNKELSIDDAFAGGVCRCQYCGTIQTVPAKGAMAKVVAGAASGSGMKTLFENKSRPNISPGSGLDELADIIASSGLSEQVLRSKKSATVKTRRDLAMLLIAAAAVIVLLAGIVAYLIVGRSPTKATAEDSTNPPVNVVSALSAADTTKIPTATANFCGVPLSHSAIAYLIDNGSSSDTVLDGIKTVVFKSMESLGPDKRFQILFWNPNSPSYPPDHTTAVASKDNISLAADDLRDVAALGSTEPTEILKTALQANPDEIILITAKAGNLDDSLVNEVMAIRGTTKIPVDCFAINGNPTDTVLSQIAAKTGGKFATLSDAQLKAFAY
jgi:hypothetical protein